MMSKRRSRMVFAGVLAAEVVVGPVAAAQAPEDLAADASVDRAVRSAAAEEIEVPQGYEIPVGAFAFAPTTAGRALEPGDQRDRQAPLALWSDGAIVATIDVPTPTERLRVKARGDACGGSPRMVVEVDGEVVLDTEVSSGWDNSTFVARGSFAAGEHEVRITFPNDLVTDACDRNLKIGDVGFFPGSELRLTATPLRGTDFRVEPASAGSTFRYGPFGEPGLVLWDNGRATATAATLGARTLVVDARADECEGPPRMQVVVNGRTVIDELVVRELGPDGEEVPGTYTGSGEWLGGTQDVEVLFVNDLITAECDRNLKVEHVTFIGIK